MTINVHTPYGSIAAPDAELAFALLELLALEARNEQPPTEADLVEAVTMDLT